MPKLTPDKTEIIIFGSHAQPKKLDSHFSNFKTFELCVTQVTAVLYCKT